jgi:Uma2 family endonuclease
MGPVVFESRDTFSQAEFAEWLETLKDSLNRYELLNGRIVMNPPSGWPHGEATATVAYVLRELLQSKGRVFGADQGFDLPSGDTVGPDAAFVSTARWAAAEPPVPGKFLRVVPDLVVEILSPSTASTDRGEKKAIYEQNGVTEYWIVDLRARRVSRYALQGKRYGVPVDFEEQDTFVSLIVPGLSFQVARLIP